MGQIYCLWLRASASAIFVEHCGQLLFVTIMLYLIMTSLSKSAMISLRSSRGIDLNQDRHKTTINKNTTTINNNKLTVPQERCYFYESETEPQSPAALEQKKGDRDEKIPQYISQ